MRSHNKIFFRKFSKYWLSLRRHSISIASLFMFCQKLNRNLICADFHLYFLIGNPTQNVYSGKIFSKVNNEFNGKNVRN